jgi:hypothetical protein
LHQVIDAPGRHATNPGLLDYRDQSLLARLPRLKEGREVTALPQLRDAQLQGAEPGVECAVAIAVAAGLAIGRAFVPSGAD